VRVLARADFGLVGGGLGVALEGREHGGVARRVRAALRVGRRARARRVELPLGDRELFGADDVVEGLVLGAPPVVLDAPRGDGRLRALERVELLDAAPAAVRVRLRRELDRAREHGHRRVAEPEGRGAPPAQGRVDAVLEAAELAEEGPVPRRRRAVVVDAARAAARRGPPAHVGELLGRRAPQGALTHAHLVREGALLAPRGQLLHAPREPRARVGPQFVGAPLGGLGDDHGRRRHGGHVGHLRPDLGRGHARRRRRRRQRRQRHVRRRRERRRRRGRERRVEARRAGDAEAEAVGGAEARDAERRARAAREQRVVDRRREVRRQALASEARELRA